MWSGPGVFTAPNTEDAVRFALTFIDVIGISLAFIGLRAAYIVLGTVFGISILFNVILTLGKSHATRLKLRNKEPVCPNIPALGIEIVGAVGFLILFIVATTDTLESTAGYWGGDSPSMTYVHAYAGMCGLLASILHAGLAVKRTAQYLSYRRSLDNFCPHCHRELDNGSAVPARGHSPITLGPSDAPAPRESFSANSVGEAEGDALIMKV